MYANISRLLSTPSQYTVCTRMYVHIYIYVHVSFNSLSSDKSVFLYYYYYLYTCVNYGLCCTYLLIHEHDEFSYNFFLSLLS